MEQQMDKGLNGAAKNVKNIASNAVSKIDPSFVDGITETLEEKIDLLRSSTTEMVKKTEELVKRHPYYVAFGAAAVGALFAGLLTRSFWSSSKH